MRILLLSFFSLTVILRFPYRPFYTSHSLPAVREGQIFQSGQSTLEALSDDPAVMLCILLGGT